MKNYVWVEISSLYIYIDIYIYIYYISYHILYVNILGIIRDMILVAIAS